MDSPPCDAAIAGAGPAGTSLALRLSMDGYNVLLFEEHATIGAPSHCAGLVGPELAQSSLLGSLVREATVNKVRGAEFISPEGSRFMVEGDTGSALVLDRKVFDRGLAQLATDRGADLRLRHSVLGLGREGLRVKADGGGQDFASRVFVGATGARGTLASCLGMTEGNVVPGIQVEATGFNLDPGKVMIYFGHDISDGLFAWVIPLDSGSARIGLCSRTRAKERLERFLGGPLARDIGQGTVIEYNTGAVVFGIRERTVKNNVLLVGDEALQTKPATGGGISYSLICSEIAHRSISRYLDHGLELSSYDREWRQVLQKEIQFGLKARKIYERLSDRELDDLFSAVSGRMSEMLSSSDFDRHSSVANIMLSYLPMVVWDLGLKRSAKITRALIGGA